MDFADPNLLDRLEKSDGPGLDDAPFGIIGMNGGTTVELYNATEARLAGLSRDRVIGQPFFESVAPCMNNFMVAQRFLDEDRIDETIDYVLTLRMRPTKVKLRMLKAPSAKMQYLLVNRL